MLDLDLFGRTFAAESFRNWRTVAKVLDGLALEPSELEFYRAITGRTAAPGKPTFEAYAIKPRRAGGCSALEAQCCNGPPAVPSKRPLKKRAGVRELDLYSLRHGFASLGRAAGESAFNVARMMGHAGSTLVDQVYAHTMHAGMVSVAERVTARALGEQPKLRVIEGGQRDVRQPLDEATPGDSKNVASA